MNEDNNVYKNLVWDYTYAKDDKCTFDFQNDWNQTLLTMFNYVNAMLCGAHMPRNKIIVVPIKFKELIETLEFYDSNDGLIANNYLIEFVDDDINYLNVQGVPLEIINYVHQSE